MNIETTIRSIVSKQLGASAETLSSDTSVRSLPAADSLKMLTVILSVEKEFDIEIPDDATFRIETIGEFERLVTDLVAAKASAAPATEASARTSAEEPAHAV
jgi:acyl carrier protein